MNRLVLNNATLRRKLRVLDCMRHQALEDNRAKPIIGADDAAETILQCLKKEGGRRIVVGIGGFPASGKTTEAGSIIGRINQLRNSKIAAHMPMDGFHLSNEKLVAGGLDGIKGDISTYDVVSYINKLVSYKMSLNLSIFAPDYDRKQHEIVENRIEIFPDVRVLVTEGIYVGYSGGKWGEVKELLNVLFYLDATPEHCADRIVWRNLHVGRGEDVIEAKLLNDFRFMEKSVTIVKNADFILKQLEMPRYH